MSTTRFLCQDCTATFADPVYFLSDDLGNCPKCDSEYIEPYEVPTIEERQDAADATGAAFAELHALKLTPITTPVAEFSSEFLSRVAADLRRCELPAAEDVT